MTPAAYVTRPQRMEIIRMYAERFSAEEIGPALGLSLYIVRACIEHHKAELLIYQERMQKMGLA